MTKPLKRLKKDMLFYCLGFPVRMSYTKKQWHGTFRPKLNSSAKYCFIKVPLPIVPFTRFYTEMLMQRGDFSMQPFDTVCSVTDNEIDTLEFL